MENECEALPGVAYRGVRDNRSTINTKTGYDDDDIWKCNTLHFVSVMSKRGVFNTEANVSRLRAQLAVDAHKL